MKNSAFHEVKN